MNGIFYNPSLGRKFMLKDRIVDWEGCRCRLELSHDNFSTEYKLEKKEREREAILRTIPGGFARVDARDMRTVLWYGGNFLELIGYTKEQFEDEMHSQCNYVHPDDIGRAARIMNNSKESGMSTAVEGRVITHDGKIKILTMTYSYVSGEESWDGIESFYSVGIDITKEREEQEIQRRVLNEAYQTARVANAAKTNFLSAMSHDIRTPMNAVMGMTEIAQANLDAPDKIRDCLNKISSSSQHLLSLINEVLDMSKIESGKVNMTLEPVNLQGLTDIVADMCRPLVNEKKQHFEISLENVKHENIIADGDRLRQVLMNLLSNAIKYTPEGGKISLKISEQYSPNPKKSQYEFVCTDNGIGISEGFLPQVFDPFARAEDHQISKMQGTGLGMAITENIVRMMNGTVSVESVKGKGSTFTVSVPFEVCVKDEAYHDTLAEPSESGDGGRRKNHEKDTVFTDKIYGKKVLLAEDNEINREIAVELLKMYGIEVNAVTNGKEAVETFEKSAPEDYSAILMDIQMPVMNGYEATLAIRHLKRKDAKTIPIIALTANAFTSDAAKARSVGMNDHVAKPIEMDRLLEVLEKWMDQKSN